MNIGIDMRMLGNRHGGIGRYVFELAKHMLPKDAGNRYTCFYNPDNSDAADVEPLKAFPHVTMVEAKSRHYSVSEQTKFLWQLNKANLDLVHFPNFNVPLYYSKPFVVTIHDMVHHKISGAKKSRLLHFYAYKKVIANAARKAQKIITVSDFSKKEIAGYLDQPDGKIEVIYEGPSLKDIPDDGFVEKVKENFTLHRPYFLFVGVLERKKNIVGLTRGFDVFMKKYGLDMDLVIAGKADKHYPDIKYKALDIKHKDRLVFTGYVSDRELAALYKGARAYVSASLHEGFGLPGVDAMQFGLPLAVSNTEVFNEIYENGAVYFDPNSVEDIAEKMYLLVRDQEFYRQQSVKSFERGKFFDWEKTAEETLKVYNSTLSNLAI